MSPTQRGLAWLEGAEVLWFRATFPVRPNRELLNALPAECRTFNLPAVSPEHWWMV